MLRQTYVVVVHASRCSLKSVTGDKCSGLGYRERGISVFDKLTVNGISLLPLYEFDECECQLEPT